MLADTTARALLMDARARLAAAGIDDASLEARVLLAHALGVEPISLLLEPGRSVNPKQASDYEKLLKRRLTREPLAYIIGEREFYGLSFLVDSRALIPRPETELLVESALEIAKERDWPDGLLVADVGTGSGCIAVSIAVHLPQARLYALDLSKDALALAAANAARHGVQSHVAFLQGDLLSPLPAPVDIIVANPPYVPDENVATIQPEIGLYEPRMAIEGGPDGLTVARRLLAQASRFLRPGGVLLMETGHGQASDAVEAARAAFPDAAMDMAPDLAGIPRVLRVLT
jgi:release factor glutamine methyltransferase